MKNKTFFATLLLFLIFLNLGILALSVTNFNTNLNAIKKRSLNEHYFIANAIISDIKALSERGYSTDEMIKNLFNEYADFYNDTTVNLKLFKGDKSVYTTMYKKNLKNYAQDISKRDMRIIILDDIRYLQVSGLLPLDDNSYSLIYLYDLRDCINDSTNFTKFIFICGIGLSIMLAVCLLLLLSKIFEPLEQISLASRTIASGNYDSRIDVRGSHELASMAENFNNMACQIDDKITQLETLAADRQQFIDNLAHELRTPLTTIYGYAEYMQKAVCSREDNIKATSYIMSEADRLKNLATSLLELATAKNSELIIREISIPILFEQVQATIFDKLTQKQVTMEIDMKIDTIKGNIYLLESLLINLINNAIRACDKDDKILLRAYADGKKKILSVEDSGIGMTDEQLANVKKVFYRGKNAINSGDGGVGLGLSICEQIAMVHQATLLIKSEKNIGSKVIITFTS